MYGGYAKDRNHVEEVLNTSIVLYRACNMRIACSEGFCEILAALGFPKMQYRD